MERSDTSNCVANSVRVRRRNSLLAPPPLFAHMNSTGEIALSRKCHHADSGNAHCYVSKCPGRRGFTSKIFPICDVLLRQAEMSAQSMLRRDCEVARPVKYFAREALVSCFHDVLCQFGILKTCFVNDATICGFQWYTMCNT